MAIEGASLRETLEQGFTAIEAEAPAPVEVAQVQEEKVAAQVGERTRDEKGRFAPGSPEDKAEKAAEAAQTPTRPSVPKSWKHDYHQHWDKIDPQLASYIAQREEEAAAGIGKHRGEAERMRPIAAAIEPFMPDLQQHGIDPAQFITNLGTAHKTLALGSPEQKLAMFAQLAQQYQVPLQSLFVQGQDGRQYFNQQLLAQAPRPQQVQQPDIRKTVQEALLEHETAKEIAAFESQKDKYPHYEKVKADMVLLLQQGRATDLPNAYNKAIRLHDDIFEEEQKRQRESSESEKRLAQDKAAKEAKARALSPRSTTPSATLATSNSGKKDIRSLLSEGYDSLATGRV
jgi:hypothetical protein